MNKKKCVSYEWILSGKKSRLNESAVEWYERVIRNVLSRSGSADVWLLLSDSAVMERCDSTCRDRHEGGRRGRIGGWWEQGDRWWGLDWDGVCEGEINGREAGWSVEREWGGWKWLYLLHISLIFPDYSVEMCVCVFTCLFDLLCASLSYFFLSIHVLILKDVI